MDERKQIGFERKNSQWYETENEYMHNTCKHWRPLKHAKERNRTTKRPLVHSPQAALDKIKQYHDVCGTRSGGRVGHKACKTKA